MGTLAGISRGRKCRMIKWSLNSSTLFYYRTIPDIGDGCRGPLMHGRSMARLTAACRFYIYAKMPMVN